MPWFCGGRADAAALPIRCAAATFPATMARSRRGPRTTAAAATVTPAHDYPRMQLRREQWASLNGRWEFAIDETAAWTSPAEVQFDRTIVVPFAPETPAS